MTRFAIAFAAAGVILAQEPAPTGIIRGSLLSVLLVSETYGSIEFRSAESQYRCYFDSQTFVERERRRIAPGTLQAGEDLEMVTDRKAGRCYARVIRVTDSKPSSSRVKPARTWFETNFPRGNLTFSGVVLRLTPSMMVLRTRTSPEQIVLRRQDTRYMEAGFPAEASQLLVNTRVFVRGGKNLDNDLEAFQVIWGEIEGPKSGSRF